MAADLYLADSNILIRLTKRDHPEYALTRNAVNTLRAKDVRFCYTLQNLAEFWNASTRPKDRNGFGLTVDETERNALEIERAFRLLTDNEGVYREWRTIVFQQAICGVQVHDARLAAAMYAHGIRHILTFNNSDFRRFPGLTAIHPQDV